MKLVEQLAEIKEKSVRDAALISMMLHHGAKPGEILQLKSGQVCWKKGKAVLGGREVELGREVFQMLKELKPGFAADSDCELHFARKAAGDTRLKGESTWIFEGNRNKALSVRQLQMITKGHLGKTPNELRREFARRFVEEGGSEKELQRVLGHVKMETTKRLLR